MRANRCLLAGRLYEELLDLSTASDDEMVTYKGTSIRYRRSVRGQSLGHGSTYRNLLFRCVWNNETHYYTGPILKDEKKNP